MKLLIITQKVDDMEDGLGLNFFISWIKEFAKVSEEVHIICLYEGKHDLPGNVFVHSLGKEKKQNKLQYLYRFYKYIIQYRKKYDFVFVHMNQIYVILGSLIWKLLNKKIGLWYAHKSVNHSLRFAEKIVNYIFTPTKKSFRLESKKINIVGHGIDINIFIKNINKKLTSKFKIITVGRISPSKDYETLIRAIDLLNKDGLNFDVDIFGDACLKEDHIYLSGIKEIILKLGLVDKIKFFGAVENNKVPIYLQNSNLFINMSHTGSLDKAILESMACELPIITCNESAMDILNDFEKYYFKKQDYVSLYKKIKYFYNNRNEDFSELRKIIVEDHNLEKLIKKIVYIYEE
ncbi:MAG: glycosyltransferase family 4 protein [Patescibacteria group bacterium]|nr:glycosyltransferase family 4 protein [Patescibacteria group bacterium]